MQEYLNTVRSLLANSAKQRSDRTGVGTTYKICNHSEYKLNFGAAFPAVTTKRLAVKSVIGELLGFIRAADSAETFRALECNVWNDNANKQNPEGQPQNAWLNSPWRKGRDDLGRIYGVQWRKWEDTRIAPVEDHDKYVEAGYTALSVFQKNDQRYTVWHREIDQLQNAIDTIKTNPNSRRIIISGWNPSDLDRGALPPCHVLQHYICDELSELQRIEALIIREENAAIWANTSRDAAAEGVRKQLAGKSDITHEYLDSIGAPRQAINLVMYQRSADTILGSPYNIASYATMMQIMARITGNAPGSLHYVTGDTHLYKNHRNAALEQVRREPTGETPRLLINPKLTTLEHFETATVKDFRLYNYHHRGALTHPTPMAI